MYVFVCLFPVHLFAVCLIAAGVIAVFLWKFVCFLLVCWLHLEVNLCNVFVFFSFYFRHGLV